MNRSGATLKKMVRLPKEPLACWEWLGSVHPINRDARKQVGGRNVPARRWMWENLFGPIPKGMVVTQECGNGACVNPYHLRMTTLANALRNGASAKLIAADAADIRKARAEHIERNKETPTRVRLSELARRLAREYEVTESTIKGIWAGDTWRTQTKHPTARPISEAQA